MWPLKPEQEYHAVAREEEDLGESNASRKTIGRHSCLSTLASSVVIAVVLSILIILGAFAAGVITPSDTYHNRAQSGRPTDAESGTVTDSASLLETAGPQSYCPFRKEWRDLSSSEQQQYIEAVLCLRTQPSTLAPGSNRTAYDDFPWIHSHVGYRTHNSAPFLPWHRYFLHIYESTLRKQCAYVGALVYWDWTLDSENLQSSPVFDAESGFGGDGEVGGEVTVGRSGRCVVDGPFAGITADYYDVKYQPHCLSRGFRDLDGNLGHMDGHDISPASIEEVLSTDNYEEFVTLMESRVHDAIPFGIAGDFETFTAPYDPLFFLHHTQLDRLWWLWQQRQPAKGLDAYSGHKERHSIDMASLDDELHFHGLAPDVRVAAVMDIESQLLCYRY